MLLTFDLMFDPDVCCRQEQDIDAMKDAEKEFHRGMPRIFQVLLAAIEVLLSRSDILCYFAMILNVLVNASLLALPYPICVFLWALLSVPRPTKTYWVTIITYTEASNRHTYTQSLPPLSSVHQ